MSVTLHKTSTHQVQLVLALEQNLLEFLVLTSQRKYFLAFIAKLLFGRMFTVDGFIFIGDRETDGLAV